MAAAEAGEAVGTAMASSTAARDGWQGQGGAEWVWKRRGEEGAGGWRGRLRGTRESQGEFRGADTLKD